MSEPVASEFDVIQSHAYVGSRGPCDAPSTHYVEVLERLPNGEARVRFESDGYEGIVPCASVRVVARVKVRPVEPAYRPGDRASLEVAREDEDMRRHAVTVVAFDGGPRIRIRFDSDGLEGEVRLERLGPPIDAEAEALALEEYSRGAYEGEALDDVDDDAGHSYDADDVVSIVARALLECAEFEVDARQDDTPLRGNVLASGDAEADAEAEREVSERLESGDVWAWALVTVRATFDGFKAEDHLGACSYEDESDFKACAYYSDMRDTCARALAEALIDSGRYGMPGSVSAGTHRPDDLREAFADTLNMIREARSMPCSAWVRTHTMDDVEEVGRVDDFLGAIEREVARLGDDWAESDEASETIGELFEALDAWALPGFHFGALEGDGADFGFWAVDSGPSEDAGPRPSVKVEPSGSRDVWRVYVNGEEVDPIEPYASKGEALEAARGIYW